MFTYDKRIRKTLRAKVAVYEAAAEEKTDWLQSIANSLRLSLDSQQDLSNNKLLTLAFAYMEDHPEIVESGYSQLE